METTELTITSAAFAHEAMIPSRHTCDHDGQVSPALRIDGIPEGTVSLALIMEDPDTARGTLDHWIVWNIDPVPDIAEGGRPGIGGRNVRGETGYIGPCPPSGTHRYFFYVFALDTDIDLAEGASKAELIQLMEGHIVGQGVLMGRYTRTAQ